MIARDRNRAGIIIWSVGNETPVSDARNLFMQDLIKTAKQTDSTRRYRLRWKCITVMVKILLTMFWVIDVDLVSVNEYLGWYSGLPNSCSTAQWETIFNKPLFFSETGAEAQTGFFADSLTRFSEDYQCWFYREQIAMMKRMPDNYIGFSPWILCDFRSPKRNNPVYQEGWNRKGVIDNEGRKKRLFIF